MRPTQGQGSQHSNLDHEGTYEAFVFLRGSFLEHQILLSMDNISSSKLWECPWPGILGADDISLEEHSSPWLLEIMLNFKYIK